MIGGGPFKFLPQKENVFIQGGRNTRHLFFKRARGMKLALKPVLNFVNHREIQKNIFWRKK
jgi:hypothetical protein